MVCCYFFEVCCLCRLSVMSLLVSSAQVSVGYKGVLLKCGNMFMSGFYGVCVLMLSQLLMSLLWFVIMR